MIVFLVILTVLTLIVLSDLKKIRSELRDLSASQTHLRQTINSLVASARKPEVEKPAAPVAPVAPAAPAAPAAPPPSPIVPPAPPKPAPWSVEQERGLEPARKEPFVAPPPLRPRPVAPSKPSPIVEAAIEVLRKIWSWIVVGEEFRPAGVSMEYAVATTWLIRAGIIAIVTCVGYFLKWSIDRNLLGPEARVGMSVFFGLALLVAGVKLLGRKWHLLGQGFLGGGIAILYFSMFATGPLYHLVPISVAFGLMVLVTFAAGILSVRVNSLLVAILGIIGGYATPILLRTDAPNLPALYAYLLLLGLGILGIARAKQWRLLNYLGFVFTYMLFIGSLPADRAPQFPLILTFLTLFFVLHSSLVFFHNLMKSVKATLLEILHMVANAVVYSWLAYGLILGVHGRPYPALMTLALSGFFIAHVWIFLKRKVADRSLLIALLALSAFYATITMPLALEKESLTISWSLLALMFLWLGVKLESPFLRRAGHALYLLVFGRLVLFDLPSRFPLHEQPTVPFAEYGKGFADRLWTFGLSIGSIFAAFFVERKYAPKPSPADEGKPLESATWLLGPFVRHVLYGFLALFIFAYLQLETYTVLGYFVPLRLPALTLLWCGMAGYFTWRFLATGKPVMVGALLIFIAVAVIKTLVVDFDSWDLCPFGYFCVPYAALGILMRFVDYASVLGFLLAAWWVFWRRADAAPLHRLFGYSGLILLFVFLTLETRSFLHWRVREFLAGGTSVLWALFAVGFLTGGIWKSIRPLRFAALTLFTIVVGKVFLVDLAGMPTIYRVVAFMAVGIFLLVGAFAYIRASKAFNKEPTREP